MRPATIRRALWTLPVTFAAGVLFHIWVQVRLLPWWPVSVAIGALVIVASKPLLFPSSRRAPDRRTLAGAAVAYTGAALLIDSLWPVVLLIPAVSFIVRWEGVRERGSIEGP